MGENRLSPEFGGTPEIRGTLVALDQREIPWTGKDLLNLIEDMEQSLKLSKMIGMESPSIFLLITSC